MELAQTISLLSRESMLQWRETSKKYWSNTKNLQRLKNKIKIREALRQMKPEQLKALEEAFNAGSKPCST